MYVKCWKKINNILKHDHGEKYMKYLFLFMLILSLYLKKKKNRHITTIQKNLQQQK